MQIRSGALLVCFVAMSVAGARSAHAQCVGGGFLKGGYGVQIYGATASGGAEALAGTMVSDGKCGLVATLSGNVNGTEINEVGATGSYAISPAMVGSLTLTLANAAPQSFAVNWVVRHRQVIGAENDGLGTAQIDVREQQIKQFGQNTLSGPYSYLCSSTGNQPALLLSVSYDGISTAQATGFQYVSGTLSPWGPAQGNYQISADGSYLLTLQDPTGNVYLFGGGIDSVAFNAPLAAVSENGSGVIAGAAHCVGQKQ